MKYNIAVQYRVSADRIATRPGYPNDKLLQHKHDNDLQQAKEHARELILAAATATRWLQRSLRRPGHQLIRTFLERTVERAGAIALAGILLADTETYPSSRIPCRRSTHLRSRRKLIHALTSDQRFAEISPAELIEYATRDNHLTYRVRYTLACYLSTAAGKLATITSEPDDSDTRAMAFVSWACPEIKPRSNWRSSVELGVFASVSGGRHVEELLDYACEQLTVAIRTAPSGKREELATWAQSDPTLSTLRENRHEECNELTDEWATRLRRVGQHRPDLRPLLKAQAKESWSIDVVHELWAYALQASPSEQAQLRKPANWRKLLKRLEDGDGPRP